MKKNGLLMGALLMAGMADQGMNIEGGMRGSSPTHKSQYNLTRKEWKHRKKRLAMTKHSRKMNRQ